MAENNNSLTHSLQYIPGSAGLGSSSLAKENNLMTSNQCRDVNNEQFDDVKAMP